MNIPFITICCLFYSANAKLVSETIGEQNDDVESVSVITTSSEEDHHSRKEHFNLDIETIRNSRQTHEHAAKTNVTKLKRTSKPKGVLVKKPIPKFTDTGSDEDYQAKMRLPHKVSDSVEHEDEDFSVDDYDFDVNHDEFAGRGKPLEPRVKVKVQSRQRKPTPAKVEQPRPAPTQIQSKVHITLNDGKPSIKVARKAATAATGEMREEEYDEEFSPITKSSENRKTVSVKEMTSSVSEETEDTKEEEHKRPIRTPRASSPVTFGTSVDQLGAKTSGFVTKVLSYLPMFPQRYLSSERASNDGIGETAPLVDPWQGRPLFD